MGLAGKKEGKEIDGTPSLSKANLFRLHTPKVKHSISQITSVTSVPISQIYAVTVQKKEKVNDKVYEFFFPNLILKILMIALNLDLCFQSKY